MHVCALAHMYKQTHTQNAQFSNFMAVLKDFGGEPHLLHYIKIYLEKYYYEKCLNILMPLFVWVFSGIFDNCMMLTGVVSKNYSMLHSCI